MRLAFSFVLLLAACTPSAPPVPVPSASPAPSSDGVLVVPCSHQIDFLSSPPPDHQIVLDTVALPTQTLTVHPTNEPGKLFAKHGLVVRNNSTVDLVVSGEDLGKVTIGWGNAELGDVTHLRVSCTGQPGWIVFAGGYSVTEPRCATLVIRVGTTQQDAHIPISKPC